MNCIRQSREIILQICDFLDSIGNPVLTAQLELFNDSSVGQHLRHIHGFFDCLLEGANSGVVNYDKRHRDTNIENEVAYCKECFLNILPGLEKLDTKSSILVLSGVQPEENSDRIESTVGREVMYAFEHALHHLAIVKMGIKSHFPDIEIDPNMGVAPSTLEYRKSCAQ